MVQMDGVGDGWWTATMFQQGRGVSKEVGGVSGRELVGPFRVPEGVKTFANYVEFWTENLLPWY